MQKQIWVLWRIIGHKWNPLYQRKHQIGVAGSAEAARETIDREAWLRPAFGYYAERR